MRAVSDAFRSAVLSGEGYSTREMLTVLTADYPLVDVDALLVELGPEYGED